LYMDKIRNAFFFAAFEQYAEKLRFPVTPAKAGVQEVVKRLDSCFRRNDDLRSRGTFSATCYGIYGIRGNEIILRDPSIFGKKIENHDPLI